jgi:GTP-binding protein HflX
MPVTSLDSQGRVILCMLRRDPHDHKTYRVRLDELQRLVEALDIEVVGELIQTRVKPLSRYCFGRGKVGELLRLVAEKRANLVVFYNILTSSQKFNLIRELKCEVVDRYELTLEIFDKMASDSVSKLQIEAARLGKLAPYFKLQANLRFRNEHAFFRSMGEYAFHSHIKKLTSRQAKVRRKIEDLMIKKRQRIRKRKELGYPTICITGFYNAGKTTLFNALTGESKPVSPEPFTTLSSKYQKRYFGPNLALTFIDTIGFVLDLDPQLIQSFRLNLEDIRNADVVLLLLDITDNLWTLKLKQSEGVGLLGRMGIKKESVAVVFNKIDVDHIQAENTVNSLELDGFNLDWISISAKERINFDELIKLICKKLNP